MESQPDWWAPYKVLWFIEHDQGHYEEAITAASKYFMLRGEMAIAEVLDAGLQDIEYQELMRRAADHFETDSIRPYVSHIEHAQMRMHSGELDKALDHLEQAYQEHESHLVYTIAEPLFRPIWTSERYKELLNNINYK